MEVERAYGISPTRQARRQVIACLLALGTEIHDDLVGGQGRMVYIMLKTPRITAGTMFLQRRSLINGVQPIVQGLMTLGRLQIRMGLGLTLLHLLILL